MSEPLNINAQLLHGLQDHLENIRFAKQQQWQVGIYTLTAYGALVAALEKISFFKREVICINFFQLFLLIAAVIGLLFVWHFQSKTMGLRKESSEKEKKLGFPKNEHEECKFIKYDHILYDSWIAVMISGAIIFGLYLAWNWN